MAETKLPGAACAACTGPVLAPQVARKTHDDKPLCDRCHECPICHEAGLWVREWALAHYHLPKAVKAHLKAAWCLNCVLHQGMIKEGIPPRVLEWFNRFNMAVLTAGEDKKQKPVEIVRAVPW